MARRYETCALPVVFVLGVAFAARADAQEDASAAAAVEWLLKAGVVGTDEPWRALLEQHRQRQDLPAPADLRGLLAAEEVRALELSLDYWHVGVGAELSWYASHLRLSGSPEQAHLRLAGALAARGFAPDAREPRPSRSADSVAVRLSRGAQEVEIEVWPAVEAGSCNARLLWCVRDARSSPRPTLKALLDAIPALRADQVEPDLYETLSGVPVQWLCPGPSTWEVNLLDPDRAVSSRVQELLRDLGYQLGPMMHLEQYYDRESPRSSASTMHERNGLTLRLGP